MANMQVSNKEVIRQADALIEGLDIVVRDRATGLMRQDVENAAAAYVPAGFKLLNVAFNKEDGSVAQLEADFVGFNMLCDRVVRSQIKALLAAGRDISELWYAKRVLELVLLKALGVSGDVLELRMLRDAIVGFWLCFGYFRMFWHVCECLGCFANVLAVLACLRMFCLFWHVCECFVCFGMFANVLSVLACFANVLPYFGRFVAF
jgi:hypothetical protein